MQAGALDRRITIEQITGETLDANNAAVPTWGTFAERWAKKIDLKGREIDVAAVFQGEVDTEFKIRWLAGLKNEMRIQYGGRVYDIEGFVDIGRNVGIRIFTTAEVE